MSMNNIAADSLGNEAFNGSGAVGGKAVQQSINANGTTVETDLVISENGGNSTAPIGYAANASSATVANAINTATTAAGVGIKATVENDISVSFTALNTGDDLTLTLNSTTVNVGSIDKDDLSSLAAKINESGSGITATVDSDDPSVLKLSSNDDIFIDSVSAGGDGATSIKSADGTVTAFADDDDTIAVGQVKLSGNDGFTVTNGVTAATNDMLGIAASTVANSALDAVDDVDLSTQSGSQDALAVIDAALASIDGSRADLGAIQNRFDYTISNLANVQENVSASRGRIQDTDFAVETANLTKNQILQQAGTSILAQANQIPQAAISLIGG
jgi:flagellin